MKDKVRGKAEEVKGRVTGDRTEELKGKARQKVGDVKRATKRAIDEPDSRRRSGA